IVDGVASSRWTFGPGANAAAPASTRKVSTLRTIRTYLKRSSKDFLALDWLFGDEADLVSRSTVVRTSNSAHSFRASFGEMRAGTGFWHSKVALESKFAHGAQLCRAAWHCGHAPVPLPATATVSSAAQRTHFTTSRKPGMLKVFGAIGG